MARIKKTLKGKPTFEQLQDVIYNAEEPLNRIEKMVSSRGYNAGLDDEGVANLLIIARDLFRSYESYRLGDSRTDVFTEGEDGILYSGTDAALKAEIVANSRQLREILGDHTGNLIIQDTMRVVDALINDSRARGKER